MEYQGEVMNNINGEERVRNGVCRRSDAYINGEERVSNGVRKATFSSFSHPSHLKILV